MYLAVAAMVGLMAAHALYGQAPAQAAQQQWKEGEYAMYDAAQKETQPAKKIDLIIAWRDKFPTSDFDPLRRQMLLQADSQVLTAAYSTQDPAQLATASKVASDVLANLDTLFASKPATVSDADWATAKKSMQLLAQNIPGYVAWQQKDLPKAEEEFTKSLQADPNQAQVSLWLWTIVAGERKPEKYSLALYEYARAANYDGPGALDPATRQKAKADFENIYTKYHGSNEGLAQLEEQAKGAALPAIDVKILSKADVVRSAVEAENAKQEELRKQNPSLALWLNIKTALTGTDADSYFNSSMKGAALPAFTGTLIEAKPAVRPKELVLAIADGKTPDAVLKLDVPLAGKMEPGAQIGFQGVASTYTASPFLVTFDVEKAKVTGWKG